MQVVETSIYMAAWSSIVFICMYILYLKQIHFWTLVWVTLSAILLNTVLEQVVVCKIFAFLSVCPCVAFYCLSNLPEFCC